MWGPVHVGAFVEACACRGLCMWRLLQGLQHLTLCMLAVVLFQTACTGVCAPGRLLACQRSRLYKCMMFVRMVMSSWSAPHFIASLKVSSQGPLFTMRSTACPCAFAHLPVPDNACRCVHLTNQVAVSLSRLPQLVDLDLSDCNNLGDAGLQSILKGLPLLQNLSLQHCAHITDSGAIPCRFTHAANWHSWHMGMFGQTASAKLSAMLSVSFFSALVRLEQ